jgi:ATP-dependent DNA helicase RecQ
MEDGKEYSMTLLLEVVKELKEKCTVECLLGVLTGETGGKSAKKSGGSRAKTGKAGAAKSESYWADLIKEASLEGLLEEPPVDGGILQLTTEGSGFLDNPCFADTDDETPKSGRNNEDEEEDEEEEDDDAIAKKAEGIPSAKNAGIADAVLYDALKNLLKTIAQEENLPPYVIFHETSLEDMCVQYPTTMEEMTQILGVGAGKAQKYGQPFIRLIREYVEDNEIERPQDMVAKSSAGRSGIKVYIIHNIDRKIALEDVCIAKNMNMDELLAEIETIVASGTKIDLDYYIQENIDAYRQEEIMDYLTESQEDSVEKALSVLGEDEYTMDEIRLMRIKFLSDRGN